MASKRGLEADMIGLSGKYEGDKWMNERLKKLGSKRTIHEVYGLLHGCIAATRMVMPSQYFKLIFDEEGAALETENEAKEFLGNLMNLWNLIAKWQPETTPFLQPAVRYPNTREGLKDRTTQYASLIDYFIKGLDLGGTYESDFSDDALSALEMLSEAGAFLKEYARLAETDKSDIGVEEAFEMIGKLEDIAGDCIAQINIGLKDARMRNVQEMQQFTSRNKEARRAGSNKVGRNEPCPCGSGKKYKKCCGLKH